MLKREVILDDEFVKYKKCGNQYLLYKAAVTSPGNYITKLSSSDYFVNSSHELRHFRSPENNYKSFQLLYKSLHELKELLWTYTEHSDHCLGITLTYKEMMRESYTSNRHFGKFIEKLRAAYGPLEYIVVAEYQTRGVLHFHVVIIFPRRAPYIDNAVIAKMWKHGFTYVEKIKSNKQVASYFCNYNLDLKKSVAYELFPDDVDNYPKYSDLDEKGKVEMYVQGIAIRMLPRTMHIYRHSNGIKAVKASSDLKANVFSDIQSATLDASYIKYIEDDYTGDFINQIRYERYTVKKKGGITNDK